MPMKKASAVFTFFWGCFLAKSPFHLHQKLSFDSSLALVLVLNVDVSAAFFL